MRELLIQIHIKSFAIKNIHNFNSRVINLLMINYKINNNNFRMK